MYVDVLSEGSRTRVRFPPPPPFTKAKAPMILGLCYFVKGKNTLSKYYPDTPRGIPPCHNRPLGWSAPPQAGPPVLRDVPAGLKILAVPHFFGSKYPKMFFGRWLFIVVLYFCLFLAHCQIAWSNSLKLRALFTKLFLIAARNFNDRSI